MLAQITILLSDAERVELETVVSSRMAPVRPAEKAKAMLMATDNIPGYKIAERFGIGNNTVGRWCRCCYARQRMASIVKDRPRGAHQGGRMTSDQERPRQKIIAKMTGKSPWSFV